MASRRAWRTILGVVLSLAAVAGCSSAAEPAAPDRPREPLRILLVNDDGWNAPGITVLRDALRAAGHQVTVVAPTLKRDDAGMSTTMAGQIFARQPSGDRDTWAVTGTPADATLFGLRAVLGREWPSLMISGINAGPTTGLSAMQSGTVGAALTAASNSMPAISVSTDVGNPARARAGDFRRTADFIVRLVALLQQRQKALLLMPPRTVLNVNYPGGPKPPDAVTVAPTAGVPSYSMIYRRGRVPGSFLPVPIEREQPADDNDATALRSNDVALTDLSADPDRSAPPPRVAAQLAPLLTP